MRKDAAVGGPAEVLAERGVTFRVHEHPGLEEVAEVCASLGVALEETVKTLAFVTPGGQLVLAAFPGHGRVRYGALARAAGVRRTDLAPAGAERLALVAMEPGGVCPVSADSSALVVFDETVTGLGTVHCGSGRRDRTLEMTAADLLAAVPAAKCAQIATFPSR